MRLFTAIFLFLVLVASCGERKEPTVVGNALVADDDKGAVRIATMPTLDCLPLYVAYERGWLDADSIKLSFCPFTAHLDIDTALVGGSVDGAFTDIVRTERMSKNDGVKFEYLTSTELHWSLVTNKAARLNRLEQFSDKMIATTRFSATDLLTTQAFSDVKTTSPFFRVQINDLNVRVGMMLNNEMDAAWFPEPFATMAVSSGHKAVVSPKRDELKFGVLAFRGKFASKPENKRFLTSLAKAYSNACDSLNKNGLQAYSAEIQKYCQVDTAVINSLPKMVFTHTERPGEKLLSAVRDYLK